MATASVVTKTGNDHKRQQTTKKNHKTTNKRPQTTSKRPQTTSKQPQTTTQTYSEFQLFGFFINWKQGEAQQM